MLSEVIIGGIVGAAIGWAAATVWATRRARRQKDGVISLVDVSVTEAEAVLAEPGVDADVLGAIVPERPVLDITLRNDGDRVAFVRRMYLELKGPFLVPAIDDLPPVVRDFPGAAITDPLPVPEQKQPPSGSYVVNFPLRAGRYAHMVNQVLAGGEVDRFVVSLVAHEEWVQHPSGKAEQGKGIYFYEVTVSLDYGRTRRGRRRARSEPILATSEPITVLAARRPGGR